MKPRGLSLVLLSMSFLAACGGERQSQPEVLSPPQSEIPLSAAGGSADLPQGEMKVQPEALPPLQPEITLPASGGFVDLARSDGQGAVEIVIQPRNSLTPVGGLLEFDVSMNTHSVDLSMNLADLSTLETDLGLHVSAGWWSGGSGHHVQGVLTFPERDNAGRMILEGARTITLRIEGVDAPIREFQWEALPES